MTRADLTRPLAAIALAAGVIVGGGAHAAPFGFGQAFDAALAHDAQFEAARHERDATQGSVPVARAALLPSVSLAVSDGRTIGQREFPNTLNQPVKVEVDYTSPQAALQMRAPLYNAEALSRYRQALASAEGADALYRVRGLELFERLSVAYLQRMLSDDNVAQARAQVAWLQGQVEQASRRLAGGEGSRIEQADAQALLDQARARLIDAEVQRQVASRSLQRITGVDAPELPAAGETLPATPLVPSRVDEWLALADRGNPAIQARRHAIEVARQGVQRNRAGHLPRLDVVASLARSSNESLSNLNQSSHLATLGLQLNVPLYSGGGVEAGIRQALSEQARAEAELSNERRGVAAEVQRQFLAAASGAERIEAYRRALASAELVLEGVTRALTAGLRTQADVLEARSRVQSARRDLAQARIEHLLARGRLLAQSGQPLAEVVADIDRLLAVR